MNDPAPTTPPLPRTWEALAPPFQGKDGLWYWDLRTGPNLPAAPALPVPAQWALFDGPSYSKLSTRYTATLRALPVTPPTTVPPANPLPPVVVPATHPQPRRQSVGLVYSVNHTAPQTIRDLTVKGQTRNIVCMNHAGDLLIDNVVSVDAMGPAQYDGQSVYLDDIRGTTTISNSFFGYSGGRTRLPQWAGWSPSSFHHHLYVNNTTGKAGRLRVLGNIFAESGADAVEARTLAGCEVAGNFFLNCGTALNLVMGGADVRDNVIYGAQFFWDGHGWTGADAFRLYWQALCNNNVVLSRPGQGDVPKSANHPATVAWPQGGINVGGHWDHADPVWTPPPGYPNVPSYLSGTGNLISSDWPGGTFMQDGKPLATPAGWALIPPAPAYDYTPTLAAVEAGTLSIPDAISRLRADLIPAAH